GYPHASWTVPLLQEVLEAATGLSVSEDTLRRALHRLDYVCKRPRYDLVPDPEREKKTRMANLTEAGVVERRKPSKEVRQAQATTTAPPTRSRPELGPGHPRLPRVPTPALGPLRQLPHHHYPRRRPPPETGCPTL